MRLTAFTRYYLYAIMYVFRAEVHNANVVRPNKERKTITLKRFLYTQSVTFASENCNFEVMMSIRYGA